MRLGSYSSACTAAFVLSLLPGGLSVDLPVTNTSAVLTTRATPAGSCISAPDDSCTTLTGICIGKVLNGQVAANNLWSSPECFSAAFCTGVGPILDALCCAGSCEQPSSINSIDYTKIYAAIVGDCAFAAGGCSLTWTPFVNWFYNTIQATGTNSWPQDGDSVLDWWSKVATWTNFCTGDRCVDGAIPYVNLNDWTHFSGAPIVTTPGTPATNDPQYLFGDIEDDVWIVTQNDPCPSDNATDCSYDHGPPSKVVNGQVVPDGPGQFARSIDTETASFQSKRKRALASFGPAILGLEGFTSSSHRPLTSIGPQGKNCPPPVFIDDGRVPVPLNITGCEQLAIVSTLNKSVLSSVSLTRPGDVTPLNLTMPPFNDLATLITPDQCQGSTDTPVPLPILTYYCDRLPFICANIRATGLLSNDQMILTYDPFNGKTRRNGVCGLAVREAMQQAGKCDKRQHNPDYWLMSCDEFPFNMVLEGGAGNAQVRAVPTREQQYQGSLNAMVSQLIRLNGDKTTKWAGPTGKMCHAFILQLSDTRPAGLVVKAVGQLARGGAFWADRTNITPTRIITDSRASTVPPRYPADVPYGASATAIKVSNGGVYNCAPQCSSQPAPTPRAVEGRAGDEMLASSSCTRTSRPTSSPSATSAAQQHATSAAQQASAASSALASASPGLSPEQIAAAAAAIAAAKAMADSAAALTTAASTPAVASAITAVNSWISQAQTAADFFSKLGPNLPTSLSNILDMLTSSSSEAADAVDDMSGIVPTTVPITPPVDPARDPNVNTGGSTGGAAPPPAACFGPGSQGNIFAGNVGPAVDGNGNRIVATILDAGNPAYFGISFNSVGNIHVTPIDGCDSTYTWNTGAPGPGFQVDCNSKELGSYWNGRKLGCQIYPTSTNADGITAYDIFCSDDVSRIFECASTAGYDLSKLLPTVFTWSPV